MWCAGWRSSRTAMRAASSRASIGLVPYTSSGSSYGILQKVQVMAQPRTGDSLARSPWVTTKLLSGPNRFACP